MGDRGRDGAPATMRKVVMSRTGGPEVLELVEAPRPVPAAGQVVVRAEAIGVGWPDVLIRKGVYRWMPPLPTSPGSDLAGRVVAAGSGVDPALVGREVLVTARELPVRGGCYAEYLAVPAAGVFVLPAGFDLDAAVCLPNYQVAWNLVHECVTGRPVRSVFVNGVTGGVGSAVAQLARAAGMTVLGSVSSPQKAAFARSLGVDHVIDRRLEDVAGRVHAFTGGRGVDLVVDHVAGPGFAGLLDLLAKWGTLVSYNAAEGLPEANLLGALRRHGAKCLSVRIFEMHVYDDDPAGRRRVMDAVIEAWRAGRIAPVVSRRLPMSAVAEAHRMVEDGAGMGKIVLKPSLDPA